MHEESTTVPILENLDCIYECKSESKINMMVRKVKVVDYEPTIPSIKGTYSGISWLTNTPAPRYIPFISFSEDEVLH